MKIVVISDCHNKYRKLVIPECDILISCGDYSSQGLIHEVRNFHEWLEKQDAGYIISCQGNHEVGVEKHWGISKNVAEDACPGVHFIDEGLIEIEGLKIYCSAITPFFCNWAWNRYPGEDIQKHWNKIPKDIDILVTHGPPYGILDTVNGLYNFGGRNEHLGCRDLGNKILELKNLKLHCFGHIHSSSGHYFAGGILFVNASVVDEQYQLFRDPVEIISTAPNNNFEIYKK